jgi:hypothetical protein
MAKSAFSKLSPVTKIAVILLPIGMIYALLPDQKPVRKTPKTTLPHAAPPSAEASDESIQPEDLAASFSMLGGPIKDAFRPTVVSGSAHGASVGATAENSVPAPLAGGEPGWVYTGTAVANGASSALFENPSVNAGEFLTEGEKWKGLSVIHIDQDSVQVRSIDGGDIFNLKLPVETPKEEVAKVDTPSVGPVPQMPAGAPLSGPIGFGNLQVTPIPGATSFSYGGQGNGGGRRRFRQNRGGG